jgi:hypothetical protein
LDPAFRAMPAGNNAGPTNNGLDLRGIQLNRTRTSNCLLAFAALQFLVCVGLLLPLPVWPLIAASWLFYYAGAVFAFFVATKVYDAGMATVLGLLGLIPYVGFIGIWLINDQAKSVLRQNGYRVTSKAVVVFLVIVISPIIFSAAVVVFELLAMNETAAILGGVLVAMAFSIFFLIRASREKG